MFRSIDHPQGPYVVPYWSYILKWSVKHFVISTGDVVAYRVSYARFFLCREVEFLYLPAQKTTLESLYARNPRCMYNQLGMGKVSLQHKSTILVVLLTHLSNT
jgi:hypothetical protein